MKLLKKIGKLWMVVWLFVTVLDGIAAIPIYLLDIPCLKIVKDMMHTKGFGYCGIKENVVRIMKSIVIWPLQIWNGIRVWWILEKTTENEKDEES